MTMSRRRNAFRWRILGIERNSSSFLGVYDKVAAVNYSAKGIV
jgi:hypothetical protein